MQRNLVPSVRGRIPLLWLGISVGWAVVVFVTELPAWSLALWIAATVGPLIFISSHTQTTRSGEIESTDYDNEGEEQ